MRSVWFVLLAWAIGLNAATALAQPSSPAVVTDARLRGRDSGKPVMFLAHLDVVPALREDWTTDPYTLVERIGIRRFDEAVRFGYELARAVSQ